MSNAIIKQQGDSPIVADNIFQIRLGAGSFILGALAGTLVTAAVGRLTAKGDATPKPPTLDHEPAMRRLLSFRGRRHHDRPARCWLVH